MRAELQGRIYPPYRLRPDRYKASKLTAALGLAADDRVPLTYLIFLRGETLGVDLFKDLDIPREKALHGGQRYEWFAPVTFDDELSVTATNRQSDRETEQARADPVRRHFARISQAERRTGPARGHASRQAIMRRACPG
ncbi:MAG: MaoC family dehydratase N-terminal domain-containing protein [Pseudorhodoplanes sp.]|uniref:FAS1-like dehydratase domain-containing protein n=1 Tax=Pseudorhodoplanes sp. TaxID=1934341 RepID=UPI003D101BFA